MSTDSDASQLNTCYLDTTFLVNCLFLPPQETKLYLDVISKFSRVCVPEYAHKEMKLGVVRNFFWMYTKLIDKNSLVDALAALQRSALSPARYRTATAIQALKTVIDTSLNQLLLEHGTTSGSGTESNESNLARILSLELKRQIVKGWNNRLSIGKMVNPLNCYQRQPIDSETVPLSIKPDNCKKGSECCVFKALKPFGKNAKKLEDLIALLPPKAENKRRKDALKQLRLGREFGLTECRSIGDAYFILSSPKEWTILSTNIGDFAPMSEALGISTKSLDNPITSPAP